MSHRYRLIVLDWEGTLGEDPLGQVLHILSIEANRLNFGVFDRGVARQCVHFGLIRAVSKLFPALNLHEQEQLLHAVQETLASTAIDACLIAGARTFVEELYENGYLLAVATNKGHQSLQRVLHASELERFFVVTRSASQVPPKPCPQMLQEIMDDCGVDASQTLMIGDSVSDIEMACSIEVDAIGVDFYHQHADLLRQAGALHVFDDFRPICWLHRGE